MPEEKQSTICQGREDKSSEGNPDEEENSSVESSTEEEVDEFLLKFYAQQIREEHRVKGRMIGSELPNNCIDYSK